MIPLSNWLRGAGHPGAAFSEALPDEADGDGGGAEIAAAYERGLAEGERQSAELWAQRLATERLDHEAAIAALKLEAEAQLCARTGGSISECIASLRMEIETAVYEALRPFLEAAAAEKATAELLALIDADLARQSQPVIEIRAPAALHEALRGMLAEHSLACALTAANDIRMISAQGVRRYEMLAERWIGIVRGDSE